MERLKRFRVRLLRALLAVAATAVLAHAQQSFDPLSVDPQHFKVEYEDAHIRVLRFRLLPGEKSPMQDHAGRTAVSLGNSRVRLTSDDGNIREIDFHAGEALHQEPMRYSVEN